MISRKRFALIVAAVALAGMFVITYEPQAEEMPHSDLPEVSESQLDMYIKVYGSMQRDHSVVIEDAIKPYNISLDDFRTIERKVQGEPRMVERVREALREQVKAQSLFAQAIMTPTPATTPAAEKKPRKKN